MENRSKFFLRTLVPTFIIFGLQTLCSIIVTEMAVAVEAKNFTGNKGHFRMNKRKSIKRI